MQLLSNITVFPSPPILYFSLLYSCLVSSLLFFSTTMISPSCCQILPSSSHLPYYLSLTLTHPLPSLSSSFTLSPLHVSNCCQYRYHRLLLTFPLIFSLLNSGLNSSFLLPRASSRPCPHFISPDVVKYHRLRSSPYLPSHLLSPLFLSHLSHFLPPSSSSYVHLLPSPYFISRFISPAVVPAFPLHLPSHLFSPLLLSHLISPIPHLSPSSVQSLQLSSISPYL